MKKNNTYILFLFAHMFISLISCVNTGSKIAFSKKQILISGKIYKHLFLSNEIDTIEGYYRIENDSFFYISNIDYLEVDTMFCNNQYSKYYRKPYFLFSREMKHTQSLYKNPCDKLNFNFKLIFPRNHIFPPQKMGDNLMKIKHVSRDDTTEKSFIREFIINDKLEILTLKSVGNKELFYFYYD